MFILFVHNFPKVLLTVDDSFNVFLLCEYYYVEICLVLKQCPWFSLSLRNKDHVYAG